MMSVVALAGCANEVELGTADPSSTTLRIPAGERVHPEQWPDACTFLTDAEITALLPNTKGIEREPSEVTLLDVDLLSEDNLTGEAPRGSCTFDADHGGDRSVSITVTIEAVGPPADVRSLLERDRADAIENKTEYDTVKTVRINGATACFWHGATAFPRLSCHKGRLGFEVSTGTSADLSGVPSHERQEVLAQRLQPEVVKTIVAKME